MTDNLPPQRPESLRGRTVEEIKGCLVALLAGRRSPLLAVSPTVSLRLQLVDVFEDSDDETRRNLRKAITEAIDDWIPSDGLLRICQLADLAIDFWAPETARRLANLLVSGEIPLEPPDKYDTAAVIVSVVGGFAATSETLPILETLIFNERLSARHAGQLFLAASQASAKGYPDLLPWFFARSDEDSATYDLDETVEDMVETITIGAVLQYLPKVNRKARRRFLSLLTKRNLMSNPDIDRVVASGEWGESLLVEVFLALCAQQPDRYAERINWLLRHELAIAEVSAAVLTMATVVPPSILLAHLSEVDPSLQMWVVERLNEAHRVEPVDALLSVIRGRSKQETGREWDEYLHRLEMEIEEPSGTRPEIGPVLYHPAGVP